MIMREIHVRFSLDKDVWKHINQIHPSLSKRSRRSKGFDVGLAHGPDVKGTIPTIASRQCNSHSLVLLIA